MAVPTEFEGQNGCYGPPKGYTEDEIGGLPVFQDAARTVSAWKLTPEELAKVNRTGVVWVSILGPVVIPFMVSGERLAP